MTVARLQLDYQVRKLLVPFQLAIDIDSNHGSFPLRERTVKLTHKHELCLFFRVVRSEVRLRVAQFQHFIFGLVHSLLTHAESLHESDKALPALVHRVPPNSIGFVGQELVVSVVPMVREVV